jgi:hypothetical protein
MLYNMEFPLYWGLQKTGLPLIVVTCTDDAGTARNMCFLIDTGSTNNILFSFVYEHFQESFKSLEKQGSIIGFEGQQHETPQIEATFDFEGKNYTSIFSVLDVSDGMKHVQEESGVQIHGVLGIHFLVDYEWIVDFKELQLTISNK